MVRLLTELSQANGTPPSLNSTSISWTHTINTSLGQQGKILVAFVGVDGFQFGAADITSATFDGESMTVFLSSRADAGAGNFVMFLADPPLVTTGTLTVNFNSQVSNMNGLSVYFGNALVKDGAPRDNGTTTKVIDGPSAGTIDDDFTTTLDFSTVIDIVNSSNPNSDTHVVGAGQTLIAEVSTGTARQFSVSSKNVVTAGTTNMARSDIGGNLNQVRQNNFSLKAFPRRLVVVN